MNHLQLLFIDLIIVTVFVTCTVSPVFNKISNDPIRRALIILGFIGSLPLFTAFYAFDMLFGHRSTRETFNIWLNPTAFEGWSI